MPEPETTLAEASPTLAQWYVTDNVLNEVAEERARQFKKHGDQSHLPMGTGEKRFKSIADNFRSICNAKSDDGTVTFRDIILEEFYEALAESDPAKVRAELIQVAGVIVQMIEAIDRAAAGG